MTVLYEFHKKCIYFYFIFSLVDWPQAQLVCRRRPSDDPDVMMMEALMARPPLLHPRPTAPSMPPPPRPAISHFNGFRMSMEDILRNDSAEVGFIFF